MNNSWIKENVIGIKNQFHDSVVINHKLISLDMWMVLYEVRYWIGFNWAYY